MRSPFRASRGGATATTTRATAAMPHAGASPDAGGAAAAYDSFVDFDGFPAAAGASFASRSPSRSAAADSSFLDGPGLYLGQAAGGDSAGYPVIASGRVGMAPGLDWPVEDEDAGPIFFDSKHQHHQHQQQDQPWKQQQQLTPPSRDQQIFRRKDSALGPAGAPSHSSSRGSSSGAGRAEERRSPNTGGRGGIVFESYKQPSNSGMAAHTSHVGSVGGGSQRGASLLDNIVHAARSAQHHPSAPQSSHDGSSLQKKIAAEQISGRNQSSTSKSFGSGSSPVASSASRKSMLPSPPAPDRNAASGSGSPQPGIRKTGVVNKLVSLFANKQHQHSQQHQQRVSPSSKSEASASSSPQQLKHTIPAGVQFHVPAKQHQNIGTASSSVNAAAKDAASQHTHRNPSRLNDSKPPSNPVPAISPARSNSQSSVTGHSGDSSSYNPTGWPGTVDKRGRTYAMERSYSESEESSMASPRRSIGGTAAGRPTDQSYPVQKYRGNDPTRPQHSFPAALDRRGPSFDGGSSAAAGAAELEDWLKGDADDSYISYDMGQSHADDKWKSNGPVDLDSCYSANQSVSQGNRVAIEKRNERRGGPVDLDDAYERRADSGGWREGREQSLANISETRTAADVHLEAALGIAGQLRQTRSKSNVSRSYSSSSPNNSRPGEGAELHGIDLSASEMRVRASGRQLTSPRLDPQIYSDEVDFDSPDSTPPDNPYPPQRLQQQKQQKRQIGYMQAGDAPQTLSEEALRWQDSHTAPPREGASMNFRGYHGFLDKTRDVPNLMDDLESEVSFASQRTGDYSVRHRQQQRAGNMGLAPPDRGSGRNSSDFRGSASRLSSLVSSSNFESGSDVFDGIQEEPPFGPMEKDILNVNSDDVTQQRRSMSMPKKDVGAKQLSKHLSQQAFEHFQVENLPYSTQFNPFTPNGSRAQESNAHANSRPGQLHLFGQSSEAEKANFFDPDISAVTKGSDADALSHHLDNTDPDIDDNFESRPDLSIYCIQPEMVQQMVRAFRKICTNQMEISSSEETMLYDFENLVDTKKAFALFEMRSRIMETDIDRGLERMGGTNVVDDIAMTPHFQAAQRVRDAVIVSKAWRDGATPKDVVTAHLLTRRSARAYSVRRPIQRIRRPGHPFYNHGPQYWLEEVKWLDDTDFMLMRCQSLGAGTMKGFEMFTIGDCQSILLKMTSDNCTQLRRELRVAMMRQIEAEELMQEEIDLDGDENIVAEAEQLYRDATMEVKTLSIKLVLADKAFGLVRNRMEKLVETIESLLVSIENGEESGTDGTPSIDEEESDNGSYSSQESHDREKLVGWAKRAELSAELAVREALLAKEEAERIRLDKQREIDELKVKLAEMETKSQLQASEQRLVYLNGTRANNFYLDKWEAKSFLESTFDKDVEGAARKDRLKQKFRERQLPKTKEEDIGFHPSL